WKEDYGISEDFVDRVGSMIQPGDSAIFALVRTIDPDLVAAQFKGYGGTVLRTTLSPGQKAGVEAPLSRESPWQPPRRQRRRRRSPSKIRSPRSCRTRKRGSTRSARRGTRA